MIAGVWLYPKHLQHTDSIVAQKAEQGMLEEFNHGTQPRRIVLEDGSFLFLKPNAKIAFPRHFSKTKREVYLEG